MSFAATKEECQGRFIVFFLIKGFGRSRTIIFPEGSNANDWFALTKILKEPLIYGNLKASSQQLPRQVARKSRVGRNLSYANTVRGRLIDPQSCSLRGWRCRQCGSWDVFEVILGEERSLIWSFKISEMRLNACIPGLE